MSIKNMWLCSLSLLLVLCFLAGISIVQNHKQQTQEKQEKAKEQQEKQKMAAFFGVTDSASANKSEQQS